jgi:membrane dipeptidase
VTDAEEHELRLSPGEEERARRLHDESIIFISHDHEILPSDMVRMAQGGVTAKQLHISLDGQIFADLDMFLSSAPRESVQREYDRKVREGSASEWYASIVGQAPAQATSAGFLKRALVAMDFVLWQVERSKGGIRLAREPSDVLDAKSANGIALLLGSEGSRLIEERFEVLRVLVRLGLRHVELSWAWDTPVGAPQGDRSGRGLSDHGRDLIRELNALGVMVDVAHLSRQSIWDAIDASSAPVIMAHSGAEALNPEQGVTVLIPDDMIQAIAAKGGVIGVHFMSHFVKPKRTKAVIADLIRQFAHITELVGSKHVLCSPDYTLLDPRTWENQGLTGTPFSFPYGLEDISLFRNVTRGLVAGGFTDDDVRNILGRSFLQYFDQVRKAASSEIREYGRASSVPGTATEGATPW